MMLSLLTACTVWHRDSRHKRYRKVAIFSKFTMN